MPCQGSYFVGTDISPLSNLDDVEFCRTITIEAGVAAVPLSVFYGAPDAPTNFIRFCFCKRDEVLDAALERLAVWLKGRRRANA